MYCWAFLPSGCWESECFRERGENEKHCPSLPGIQGDDCHHCYLTTEGQRVVIITDRALCAYSVRVQPVPGVGKPQSS